jgi:hypothetical protein
LGICVKKRNGASKQCFFLEGMMKHILSGYCINIQSEPTARTAQMEVPNIEEICAFFERSKRGSVWAGYMEHAFNSDYLGLEQANFLYNIESLMDALIEVMKYEYKPLPW